MSELIWQNISANIYDDERDATYVVRTTQHHGGSLYVRGDKDEWYFVQSDETREGAIAAAQAFSILHPEAPVRVFRYLPQ